MSDESSQPLSRMSLQTPTRFQTIAWYTISGHDDEGKFFSVVSDDTGTRVEGPGDPGAIGRGLPRA